MVEALSEPASALIGEIESVLLARLPSLKMATAPRRIICLGTVPAALRARYPNAVWTDVADGSGETSIAHTPFTLSPRGRGCHKGAGEGEKQPFYPSPPAPLPQGERGAKHSASSQESKNLNQKSVNADLIFGMPSAAANFAPYTPAMFCDIKNALADNGVFLFATLGPQTLLPLQPLCSPATTPHDFA
ncbi:MAG: hypothetical protein LBE15_02625, partial [Burkholderiales bacterium]|nr:hypothetical protein [Burkholderiales bacterium]